jgi:hypothetical protein
LKVAALNANAGLTRARQAESQVQELSSKLWEGKDQK